jgi:hypothetical protein
MMVMDVDDDDDDDDDDDARQVRIMWMVPIYSVESWLSLRFRTYAIFIETLREW